MARECKTDMYMWLMLGFIWYIVIELLDPLGKRERDEIKIVMELNDERD